MTRKRKTTANRPSQANREFVTNSRGEKVRNVAYQGKNTAGSTGDNTADGIRGDFGSDTGAGFDPDVLEDAQQMCDSNTERMWDVFDDLSAGGDIDNAAWWADRAVKDFLDPIEYRSRAQHMDEEDVDDVLLTDCEAALQVYEDRGIVFEPMENKDFYVGDDNDRSLLGVRIHSNDPRLPSKITIEDTVHPYDMDDVRKHDTISMEWRDPIAPDKITRFSSWSTDQGSRDKYRCWDMQKENADGFVHVTRNDDTRITERVWKKPRHLDDGTPVSRVVVEDDIRTGGWKKLSFLGTDTHEGPVNVEKYNPESDSVMVSDFGSEHRLTVYNNKRKTQEPRLPRMGIEKIDLYNETLDTVPVFDENSTETTYDLSYDGQDLTATWTNPGGGLYEVKMKKTLLPVADAQGNSYYYQPQEMSFSGVKNKNFADDVAKERENVKQVIQKKNSETPTRKVTLLTDDKGNRYVGEVVTTVDPSTNTVAEYAMQVTMPGTGGVDVSTMPYSRASTREEMEENLRTMGLTTSAGEVKQVAVPVYGLSRNGELTVESFEERIDPRDLTRLSRGE